MKVEGHANPEGLISISDATATEGVDETADFVVSLNRKSSGTVTVDYATVGVTALEGVDYTATSGTLTFNPGDTSKTISVPIIDDTVNDSGETFDVVLYTPKGAGIDRVFGTGTILNTEVLTGSFENVPGEHDGSTPFTFDAIFNSDIGISYATLRDHSFTVTNGKVTRARRNNGRNDSWEITVTPWGNEALTVTLPGNRDCGTTAAICTKEDQPGTAEQQSIGDRGRAAGRIDRAGNGELRQHARRARRQHIHLRSELQRERRGRLRPNPRPRVQRQRRQHQEGATEDPGKQPELDGDGRPDRQRRGQHHAAGDDQLQQRGRHLHG